MIKRKTFLLSIALVALMLFIYAFAPGKKNKYTYEVFKQQQGWGYNILVNKTIFIHQEIIPALSVKKGFNSEKQASKAASLIVEKMQSGTLPTLTKEEVTAITEPK